jgi:hypothetical protein
MQGGGRAINGIYYKWLNVCLNRSIAFIHSAAIMNRTAASAADFSEPERDGCINRNVEALAAAAVKNCRRILKEDT